MKIVLQVIFLMPKLFEECISKLTELSPLVSCELF